jgi:hypothetical protein
MTNTYREVRIALMDAGCGPRASVARTRSGFTRNTNPRCGRRQEPDTVPPVTLGSIWRASGLERLGASEYFVIYEEAEDGASGAHLPDVPGVAAQRGTDREVGAALAS